MSHSMKTIFSLLKVETRTATVALACLVLFAGCSFAPKYAKPVVQTPAAFKELTPEQSKETDGWKTAEPKDDVIRGQWWEMFHEPELNAFESQVNVFQPDCRRFAGEFSRRTSRGETSPVAVFSNRDRQSFGHGIPAVITIRFVADLFHQHRILIAV